MDVLNNIVLSLRKLGSEERVAKSATMYPTSMVVLGVTNPDLKRFMNELYASMKEAGREKYLALSFQLVGSRVFECQMLAWMLLEKARLVTGLTAGEATRLRGSLDNWASVDTYGILIYGMLWRIDTINDADVLALQENGYVWDSRLALVATVALNLRSRGGTGDALRTLMICKRALDDHREMVVKAHSWALRSLINWDREAVVSFISEHQKRLHKRVLREVRHKLDHGTKN